MTPSRSLLKKVLLPLILLLIIAGIAIQFIRPRIDNPPVTGAIKAPPEVKAIFQRACYNCHSNETKLAWFDQVAPAYWLVAKDVKEARRVLNFSTFDSLPKGQQAAKLFEAVFQMEFDAMPLKQYRYLHPDGNISPADLTVLRQYIGTLAYKEKPDTARQRASWEQYAKWITAAGGTTPVKDEYNGISYRDLADFRNWTAVGSSERYDNGTLRVILGNDIAARAIREGHTNPWPDGSTFAKVAWDQSVDSTGEIHAGVFRQVEFMIRDAQKYGSAYGWGWARWVGGLALNPYGKNAGFEKESMNCHKPLEKNNYTFTFPLADTLNLADIRNLQDPAATHPLTGKVITSFVNTKESTMSILYGNATAVQSARSGQSYAPGSVLSLVTWSQREDPHWFGARIPRGLNSVEQVVYTQGSAPSYARYDGLSLAPQATPSDGDTQARIASITGRKASVLP